MNWWLIAVGAVLIFDTLIILTRSNLNIGVLLPAILGSPIFIYGCLYSPLNEFFNTALGAIIKSIFITAYALYTFLSLICIVTIALYAHKRVTPGSDAVIVLGAAVHGSKISLTLNNRLDMAMDYMNRGKNDDAVIVVSGAQGRQEDMSEAEASYNYLVKMGVPKQRILIEDRATNTYENFKFSKALLDKHFCQKKYTAVFVTNNFHVYRSLLAAKSAGLDIKGMGCKAKLYIQPNNYLRESLAVLKYWLLGAK